MWKFFYCLAIDLRLYFIMHFVHVHVHTKVCTKGKHVLYAHIVLVAVCTMC